MYFNFFHIYHLPLEKGVDLHLNKLEFDTLWLAESFSQGEDENVKN